MQPRKSRTAMRKATGEQKREVFHEQASDPTMRPTALRPPQAATFVRQLSTASEPRYGAIERQTWRTLFERQLRLLQSERAATEAFYEGVTILRFSSDPPSPQDLSERLTQATGWALVHTDGLVSSDVFFSLLAARKFPVTTFIRSPDELDYTPSPDVFHDTFGHLPLLTQPDYAAFFEDFGRAGLRANNMGTLRPALLRGLANLYWFTAEFGLLGHASNPTCFGAGILSSPSELRHVRSNLARVRLLSMRSVLQAEYTTWDLQPNLFVVPSFEALRRRLADWVDSWANLA